MGVTEAIVPLFDDKKFYKSYVCLMQGNIHINWWQTTGSHTENNDTYSAARTRHWVCRVIKSEEEDNIPMFSLIVLPFSVYSYFYLLTCSKLIHLVSYLFFALTVSRHCMNFKLNLGQALQILSWCNLFNTFVFSLLLCFSKVNQSFYKGIFSFQEDTLHYFH